MTLHDELGRTQVPDEVASEQMRNEFLFVWRRLGSIFQNHHSIGTFLLSASLWGVSGGILYA